MLPRSFSHQTSDLPDTSVIVHLVHNRKSVAKHVVFFSSCISFELFVFRCESKTLSKTFGFIYKDSEFTSNKFSGKFAPHISPIIFREIENPGKGVTLRTKDATRRTVHFSGDAWQL